MKKWIPVAAAVSLFACLALAQLVDQGRPGKQGPWPVSGAVTVLGGQLDGGASSIVQARPYKCGASSVYASTSVTTTAGLVPASASTLPRAYMVVCNSKQNTAGNLKCHGGGVVPVFAATNPGDYFGNGDCVKYTQDNVDGGSPVICVSDQAGGINVTTFQCL